MTLKRKPKKFNILYFDLRRTDLPDFFEAAKKICQRQIGIILRHEREPGEDIRLQIYAKRNIFEGFKQHFVAPEYPPDEIFYPSLLKILDREQFPDLDGTRYVLLKWAISDSLFPVDLLEIPEKYLRNVLTLYYMVQHKFIDVGEADILLLTLKNVELGLIPDDLDYTLVVDERAFGIPFLFSKCHQYIGRTINIVGLGKLNTPLNFDGVFFHKTYLFFKIPTNDPLPLLEPRAVESTLQFFN